MTLKEPTNKLKFALFAFGFLVFFILVYFKLAYAEFVSWDDAEYILENKDVHDFNMNQLLSKFYVGNFHPITMLNYAIDWKMFDKTPMGYHVENVIWHLINSILVYYVMTALFKDELLSLFVTIVFAFHPIQIETIAWIAERKNLISTFFILLSFISYLKFTHENKIEQLCFSVLFFCFSLLCKPSFVIFPLILFLVDWHFFKNRSKHLVLQKIPFFLASLIISIITLKAQQDGGYLNTQHAFPIYQKIAYSGFAIGEYLYHFFMPNSLSVIYPYPQHKVMSMILGYITLIVLMIVIYKSHQLNKSLLFFGILFFAINLLLVLQFIPFGEVLTADRYMYVAMIGLSILVFGLIKKITKQFYIIIILLTLVLGGLSNSRLKIWQNSITLYQDILLKNPHSYIALNSIGAEYMKRKDYLLSEKYYRKSINENANYYKSYYNRALLYSITNQTNKAIADYTRAIKLNNYYKAYVGRANIYYSLKDFSKTISDAEKAISLNKNYSKANFVLANCYDDLNKLDQALFFYNKAIINNSEDGSFFLRRAVVFGKKQQFVDCLNDLEKCTQLEPNDAEAYFWKGVAKVNLKKSPCADFKKALDLGFTEAQNPYQKYCY
ncbi:MAG: hypothetical protein ACK50L_03295 [Bacteroidota bacterium]